MLTGKARSSKLAPDFGIRAKLEELSVEELANKLIDMNPNAYSSIDKNNKRRLVRALEIEISASKEPSHLINKGSDNLSLSREPNKLSDLKEVEFFYIGLTASREVLYQRVDAWVDSIWNNGLVEETLGLIRLGYTDSRPLNGIVYKTVKEFLAEQSSQQDAVQRIKFDLHSYIRRQQTWFKRNEKIKWFDISDTNFSKMVFNHVESTIYG
jgi:tRNA dimethylallyltransferase